jgi:hypothetical protein
VVDNEIDPTTTDDGMKLLLLLRDCFKDDLVRLLFLYSCALLIKRGTTLWARMMNSGHDVCGLRVS